MSTESQSFTPIIQYLRPPSTDLWCWLDDGETIAWQDDRTTVTFAKELSQTLAILSSTHHGLPSFTAVIVALSIALERSESNHVERRLHHWLACQRISEKNVDRVIESLSRWPEVLRNTERLSFSSTGVAALLAFGLRDARDWLRDTADSPTATILEELDKDPEDRISLRDYSVGFDIPKRLWHSMTKRAWETLLHLSRQTLDPTEISTWLRTGLIDLPAPIDPPPIDRTPVTSLLQTLCTAPDTHDIMGMAANTAASISSMVSLPRRPSQPDELPLGGFSDITNRGTPDRLLISELALPTELLMARIAQGEALYVRREVPPGPSPPIRPVLIEQTLRCWGDTRVRMAALALAYGSLEERAASTRCRFMAVNGHHHLDEDFTTREGLVRHLERLSLDRHPVGGIKRWLESIDEDSESLYAEPVILVGEETEADSDFLAFWHFDVNWRKVPSWIVVVIDHGGSARLKRRTANGDEVLSKLPVDLQRVDSAAGQTLIKRRDELPAFVERLAAPARMGLCDQPRFCFTAGDRSHIDSAREARCNDAWAISHDRRLLRFEGVPRGSTRVKRQAIEVLDALPTGDIFRVDVVGNDLKIILGKPGSNEHHLIRLALGEDENARSATHIKLDGSGVTDYAWRGDQWLRFRGKDIDSLNVETGEVEWTVFIQENHLGDGIFESGKQLSIWSGNQNRPLIRWRDLGNRPYRHGTRSYQLSQTYLLAVQAPWKGTQPDTQSFDRSPLSISTAAGPVIDSTSRFRLLHQGLDEWGDDQQDFAFSMRREPWLEEMQSDAFARLNFHQRARLIFANQEGEHALIEYHSPSDTTHHLLWSFKDRRLILTTINGLQQLRLQESEAADLISQKSLLVHFDSVSLSRDGLFLRNSHAGGWRLLLNSSRGLELRRFTEKSAEEEYGFERVQLPRSSITGCGPRWMLRRARLPFGMVFLDSRGWMHLRSFDDAREVSIAMVEGPCSGWFSESGCFGSEVWSIDSPDVAYGKSPNSVVDWCANWFGMAEQADARNSR